jgi:hypothetical protein
VRPCHLIQPKIRLTEYETDLITILRCFLLFQTVVTSRNIIAFKIKFSLQKKTIRVCVRSSVPRPASWHDACWCRDCSRPEDLLLAQAESDTVGGESGRGGLAQVPPRARRRERGGWLAKRRERGGGRRETLPLRQRGLGEIGRLGRQANRPIRQDHHCYCH